MIFSLASARPLRFSPDSAFLVACLFPGVFRFPLKPEEPAASASIFMSLPRSRNSMFLIFSAKKYSICCFLTALTEISWSMVLPTMACRAE